LIRRRNGDMMPSEINYFEPLGVEGTFSRAFGVLKGAWATLLSINALAISLNYLVGLVTTASVIASALSQYNNHSYNENNDDSYQRNELAMGDVVRVYLALLFMIAFFYLTQSIADGASIHAIALVYLGKKPGLYECLKTSVLNLGSLLLSWLVVMIGLILIPYLLIVTLVISVSGSNTAALIFVSVCFYMACVYVVVIMYFVYPVIMVEGKPAITSISRSVSLTSNHKCYIMSILILFTSAKLVINAVVSSIMRPGDAYSAGNGLSLDVNFGGAGDGIVAVAFGILFAAFGST